METLPEDMLHYLFRFLNLRSKLSLGATCRKLYEFETEKNIKRFDYVSCDITCVIATEHRNKHELDLTDQTRAKKAVRVFRKARIKDFAIRIDSDSSISRDNYELISTLFEEIKTRTFEVIVDATNEHATDLLKSFLRPGNLSDVILKIEHSEPRLVPLIKKMLCDQSEIGKLYINWKVFNERRITPDNEPIDEDTFLYLVIITKDLELEDHFYDAPTLLAAFQICFDSIETKRVQCGASEETLVNLRNLIENDGNFERERRKIRHKPSGTTLDVHSHVEDTGCIDYRAIISRT